MSYRTAIIWTLLVGAVACPVLLSVLSPLLQSRSAVYVIGGLSGVVALALMLLQPLLAAGLLPGVNPQRSRLWHRCFGVAISLAVSAHIAGLYLASPADMIDALLLVSPTPFSIYGVVALWALILTLMLFLGRRFSRLSSTQWRVVHTALVVVVVIASVVHAVLIEGAMHSLSKWALCSAIVIVTLYVVFRLRVSNRD